MTRITLAAIAALLVAGAVPAQAKTDCNAWYKDFFERLMREGSAKMTGGQLAEASRKGVRAYDACAAGDEYSVHGVWDQIEKDMKK
jgi:hypothetical protein